MIAADQPTIFPANVHVVTSSKTDGSVKFGVDQSDEMIKQNLVQISTQIHCAQNEVVGQLITYDEKRTYDVIVDLQKPEKVDITDKSTWVAADALVTQVKGLGMLLPIADCNAVVVYDPEHEVLALAHIGWHAAVADLPKKLVDHLVEKYQSKPEALLVYISPSIRKESYVNEQPVQFDKLSWTDYLEKIGDMYYVDVFGFVRDQLIRSGVTEQNLQASDVDVAKSDNYFSHFREKQNGQQAGRFSVLCVMK